MVREHDHAGNGYVSGGLVGDGTLGGGWSKGSCEWSGDVKGFGVRGTVGSLEGNVSCRVVLRDNLSTLLLTQIGSFSIILYFNLLQVN